MTSKEKATEKKAATDRLKGWLKDGDTLYFILRGRSASGMQRRYSVKQIEVTAVAKSGIKSIVPAVSDLTWNIHLACGYAANATGAYSEIKVNGCGFSAEQEIADSVARVCGFNHLGYETL